VYTILLIGAIWDFVERRVPAQRVYSAPPINDYQIFPQQDYPDYWISEILFHGTPSCENASDIIDANSGFVIGPGNAYGTGLYLADFESAKAFAKGTGAILEISLEIPPSQVADFDSVVNSPEFQNWCSYNGKGNQGDNLTAYTLSVLRKRFIRCQNIYVALAEQTFGNERVVFEGVTVLGILDAMGNPS
jgi:hypothetical protein